MQEILTAQGVTNRAEVDCQAVSDEQLEQLGDAVMEVMHPGEQHEIMDQMMGGEGSESLKFMHIRLGQNYLGCANSGNYLGLMGRGLMGGSMMGSGMMGSNFYPSAGGSFMMSKWLGSPAGYSWLGLVGVVNTILVWALLILGILALFKWLTKK